MTEHDGLLVRELLPERYENLGQAVKDNLFTNSDQPTTGFADWIWSVIGERATDAINESLNFDVLQVLAYGWCLSREIEEMAAKHQKRKATVFLGEHKFPVELHPILTITVDPFPARRLRFTLELAVNVHAIALSIRAGHLVGIAAGDYEVSAQLKYGEVKLHPREAKSKRRQLTREYKFKEPGIAIGSAQETSA